MKKNLWRVFSVSLSLVLFSAFAFAQENRQTVSAASSLYVISAEAGGVNYVEGKVGIARKNGKSGYLLKGDKLEIGDKVSTGADGKAEILLNPGSFVRLGQNSVFEFTTTALEDLQLKLDGGSAIFEVITDNAFTFAVNTPKADFYIVKSGVYRIDVLNDGAGKIEVWKGKAEANGTEIKGGKQAIVKGSQTAVVKFDRGDKDSLEAWSKTRAKELAKVNARLQNSAVRTSLMSSYYRTRWSMYNSYGLWIFSRFDGSYCFLPFGYGWSSPYGYYYYRDIWYYNLPPVIYNAPPPTNTMPTLAGGGVIPDKIRNNQTRRDGEPAARLVPPFQRVQKDIGQYPSNQQMDSPTFQTVTPSAPVYSPPPPAPVVLQAPTAPPSKGNN